MSQSTLPSTLLEQTLTPDQKTYLEGFFAGVKERAVVFAHLFPGTPPPGSNSDSASDEADLTAEERIKREEHPLDSYYRIAENARAFRRQQTEASPIRLK